MKRKVLRITGHYPEDSSVIVEKLQLLLPDDISADFYISSNLQVIEINLVKKEVSIDDSFKILNKAESFIKEAFAPSNKINVSLEVD